MIELPHIFRTFNRDFFPREIHDAAALVHDYMQREGLKDWRFEHVASRDLLEKTERELDEFKDKCKALQSQVFSLRSGLRDQFAISIAGGLTASAQLKTDITTDSFAKAVYEQADAMLAEREKGTQ